MPRFIAIILLGVIAWQSGGFYLAFEMLRTAAHQDGKARVNEHRYVENDIVVLCIDKDSLSKWKPFYLNEYTYNGKLYDVLSVTQENDSTYLLYCLHDKVEQAIYKNLYAYYLPIHSPIGAKKAQQLFDYFSLKYIIPQINNVYFIAISVGVQIDEVAYLPLFWDTIYIKVIAPPPKIG